MTPLGDAQARHSPANPRMFTESNTGKKSRDVLQGVATWVRTEQRMPG